MTPNEYDDEMRDEYDFSQMKWSPNPFVQRLQELNLVSLDADVKAVFPDSQSVNNALRSLIRTARSVVPSEPMESVKETELPKAS